MTESPPVSWPDLFPGGTTAGSPLRFHLIRKSGEPFLLLPLDARLAQAGLALYPAQSGRARLAKRLLQWALQMRLPLPLEKANANASAADPFSRFLAQAAGTDQIPAFALLCGNPNVTGRRFILLPFNREGQPACVVKAGIGEAAGRLIHAEAAFLKAAAERVSSLPKLHAEFTVGSRAAIALEYLAGDAPTAEDRTQINRLLSSWLDRSRCVRCDELPAWQSLAAKQSASAELPRLAVKLETAFHPALFHGDFAPWNLKVSRADGSWRALDWERGEFAGLPGWDWFHYTVQTSILVEKMSAAAVVARLEDLLASAPFQDYARAAKINGCERALAAAYAVYCREIIAPSEGRETGRQLAATLCGDWLDGPQR